MREVDGSQGPRRGHRAIGGKAHQGMVSHTVGPGPMARHGCVPKKVADMMTEGVKVEALEGWSLRDPLADLMAAPGSMRCALPSLVPKPTLGHS